MTRAADPKQLLRQLGTGPSEVEAAGAAQARRARVVARLGGVMREELERQKRARSRRLRFVVAAAAAAVALVAVGAWKLQGPDRAVSVAEIPAAPMAPTVAAIAGRVSVTRVGSEPRDASDQAVPLKQADEVSTGAAGAARIVLASGATVRLGAATKVQLSGGDDAAAEAERLELRMGRIELTVPPLGDERSLEVATVHGRAVVHGTRFSVAVVETAPGDRLRTVVEVAEGLVVVHAAGRQSRLGPGSRWSSDSAGLRAEPDDMTDADESPPAEADAGARSSAAQTPAAVPTAEPASTSTEPPMARSTLAEQNRLFAKALEARRRGDDRAVVAHLDELLRKHPDSALAPEARLERSRAVERLERPRSGGAGSLP